MKLLSLVCMVFTLCSATAEADAVDQSRAAVARMNVVLDSAGTAILPCGDERIIAVLEVLDTLRDGLIQLQATAHNPNAPDYTRYLAEQKFIPIKAITIDAFFSAGLKLETAKCFDQADVIYRQVVESFPGMADAGYRDRAMLHIQDIRSQRSRSISPPPHK